jgi:cell wall-associated NlpC family hydrolase
VASVAKNRRIAKRAAQREGIDAGLFLRQMGQEAGFEDKTSPAGAQGPAQFMPATARSVGVTNVHDPHQAYAGAAKLMRQYLDSYHGDWKKALTAYNAGPGAVGGSLPAETRNYISTIVGGGSGRQSMDSSSPLSFAPDKLKLGTKTSFDEAGFKAAKRKQLVASLLSKNHSGGVLFRTGVLSTAAPDPAAFTKSVLTSSIDRGGLTGGDATSGDAPLSVQQMLHVARAQGNRKLPYLWGGGHGSAPAKVGERVDCSGYVSQILGVKPRVSGDFARFGEAGPGKRVTIYANSGHVLVNVAGHWFATSSQNPGGGAGEISAPSKSYLSRFTVRHPKGL